MTTLRDRLSQNALANDPRLESLLETYNRKTELGNEVKALKKAIRQATAITQMEELKCRKRVLRRYVSAMALSLLSALARALTTCVRVPRRVQARVHDGQRCHRAQGPRRV